MDWLIPILDPLLDNFNFDLMACKKPRGDGAADEGDTTPDNTIQKQCLAKIRDI